MWQNITTEKWVLEIITMYTQSILPPSLFRDLSCEHLVHEEMKKLLQLDAIELVSIQHKGEGFLFQVFSDTEKEWWVETHSRLKGTQQVHGSTTVQDVVGIISSLDQRDWFSALDLQDAYFHITINWSHRRFLRFTLGQDHFQYKVLPFSLSSALRVFSKVLAVVAAHFQKQRIIIFPYLDDCLLKAPSLDKALIAMQSALDLFLQIGFQINTQKSALTTFSS